MPFLCFIKKSAAPAWSPAYFCKEIRHFTSSRKLSGRYFQMDNSLLETYIMDDNSTKIGIKIACYRKPWGMLPLKFDNELYGKAMKGSQAYREQVLKRFLSQQSSKFFFKAWGCIEASTVLDCYKNWYGSPSLLVSSRSQLALMNIAKFRNICRIAWVADVSTGAVQTSNTTSLQTIHHLSPRTGVMKLKMSRSVGKKRPHQTFRF